MDGGLLGWGFASVRDSVLLVLGGPAAGLSLGLRWCSGALMLRAGGRVRQEGVLCRSWSLCGPCGSRAVGVWDCGSARSMRVSAYGCGRGGAWSRVGRGLEAWPRAS